MASLFFDLIAARTFLAIQNICVSICALGISWFLWMYGRKSGVTPNSSEVTSFMVNDTSKEEELLLGEYNTTTNDSTYSNIPSFEAARIATIVGVISISSIARLASSGTVIILQKDWVVVIADNDTDYLASTIFFKFRVI